MKKLKKILAILMFCIIIFQILTGNTTFKNNVIEAQAGWRENSGIEHNGWWDIWIDINSNPYTTYSNQSMGQYAYSEYGCAWFASARACQITNSWGEIYSGTSWFYNYYNQNGAVGRGQTISSKALACWENHVAVVEAVNGDTAIISEGGQNYYSNYEHGFCVIRSVNISTHFKYDVYGGGNFLGFVYLKEYNPNPQVDYMQLYVDAPMDGDVVKGKQLEVWGWSQYKKYENDPLIGANITASINGKTYNLPPVEHLLEDKLPRFWTFLPETAIKGGKNTITVTASYNGITQSQTKTFTVTTPSISNVKCSEQDTSSNPYYTVTCNVSDDTEVAYVDFKIWTEANGEDDVEWQKAAVNKKTGTATCKIYKHKNEKGKYKVTIYAHRTETIYSESTYSFESLFVYPLKNISLNKTAMSINTGETENLSVNYNPSYTTDNKAITWSSNNPQIVTVSNTGQVMAKTKGTAIITAKVGNYSAYCTVTVNDIIPTGISLDKTNITLTSKNETATLKATVKPDDAKDKSIKWSTDNSAVAIVDGNGKVTAVGNGIATITAMTNSGAKSATCVVIVNIQNKIILGDVNNDGFINIQDAVILKKHLAGVLILNINKTASDINNDGKIDISDAVVLLKHLAGIIV